MSQQWPFDVDQGPQSGTPIDKGWTQGLVMGQSMLQSGGIPTVNGTLSLTQPATVATYNDGAATFLTSTVAATPLSFTASKDTYVDLSTSGAYTLVAVTNGATAPAVTPASIRLYKAISGASSVTSIVPLLPTTVSTANGPSYPTPVNPFAISAPDETAANITAYGSNPPLPTDTLQQAWWRIKQAIANGIGALTQSGITYDPTEAASAAGTASLLSNMNHLRQGLQNLFGDTFAHLLTSTKTAILSDGTNAGPTVVFPGAFDTGGQIAVGGPLLFNDPTSPTISTALPGASIGQSYVNNYAGYISVVCSNVTITGQSTDILVDVVYTKPHPSNIPSVLLTPVLFSNGIPMHLSLYNNGSTGFTIHAAALYTASLVYTGTIAFTYAVFD